jgi:hypothetical protein
LQSWNCRASQNTLISSDTLAPCFPMYSANYDWGTIGNPKFERRQFTEMKKSCESYCFSALNHIVGFCYKDAMRRLKSFNLTTSHSLGRVGTLKSMYSFPTCFMNFE